MHYSLESRSLYSEEQKDCCIGIRGARGVMVIVVGNGHGNTSSNPGLDCLLFT